jgi:cellulose synthase/poly-beta-1,6-N-acetylglucosamine synthase-like glycosyltransferase
LSISFHLMAFLTPLLVSVSSVSLILCAFFSLECWFAWKQQRKKETKLADLALRHRQQSSLAVIIPAHNESAGIKKTIDTIKSQLCPQDYLIVVADNCDDDTASVARHAGASVLERRDATHRGKGYALDFGLQHLASINPPDLVAFIDADCDVAQGSLFALRQQASDLNRPVQATYLMEKPSNQGLKVSVSAFAFKVKNLVRPLGLFHMGQSCLLTGTGIVLPWAATQAVNIASSNIVEDMKLGLDLAIARYAPLFCEDALVISRLPEEEQAAMKQRTRWEHGHLQTIIDYVPQLLIQALAQKRLDLLFLALEISVLPLSLMAALTLALFLLSCILAYALQIWVPLYISGMTLVLLFGGILIAWQGFGKEDLSLKDLMMAPLYLLWKIPLYFKFLIKPEQNWIRTKRDA